ncbi:MAG: ATP-binding protein [candidate division NC10 bacterium]|nr:ATP-binding protein [candidate division NC10 bacterium]
MRLHWRITLAYLALICALFLAAYLYIHFHLEALRETEIRSQLERQAQMVKALWEEQFSRRPFGYRMDGWADQLAPYLGARITIIDGKGKVWADSELSGRELKEAENHRSRPEVQEAMAHGVSTSLRYSATSRSRLLYVAARLEDGGSPVGVVRLALSLHALDRLYSRIKGFLLAALLFSLLFGLLFTYTLSRLLSRPLLKMTSLSQRMAEGDFSRRASGLQGGKELNELALAINRMAEETDRRVREITRQKDRLQAILSGMGEGVMVVDREERIVLMNPALRNSFSLALAPEGISLMEALRNVRIREVVRQAMGRRGEVVQEEISVPGPPPRTFRLSAVSASPQGSSSDVVCVFSDITELRRLETIRRDFVANVSHELRTPLSSIKGYSETLLDGALEDQAHARGFVETILRQADHLETLINDLLDLARIESGKMELLPVPLRLQEIIPQVLEPFRPLWEARELRVQTELDSSLPAALADPSALRQILSNLMDNAIKFTPPKGEIQVRASLRADHLQVEVRDSGIGISSSDLPRIFERFYRADAGQARPLGSTGLGLAIVKHLVQAQGGQVWAESQLGAGSTFFFTLPLASVP